MKDFILGLMFFLELVAPLIAFVLVLCGFERAGLLWLCGGLGGVVVGLAVVVRALGDGLRK